MGGEWGEIGGNGVLWGEVGANNKNCGAGVDWFGFPISPHFPPFPPFFLGSFHQCSPPPPPPIALLPIRTMFFDLFSPKNPRFSIEHPKFPTLSPISPPCFLNQPISGISAR